MHFDVMAGKLSQERGLVFTETCRLNTGILFGSSGGKEEVTYAGRRVSFSTTNNTMLFSVYKFGAWWQMLFQGQPGVWRQIQVILININRNLRAGDNTYFLSHVLSVKRVSLKGLDATYLCDNLNLTQKPMTIERKPYSCNTRAY